MHECNLLIATSVLEEGIELPRCNLVVRFDEPKTYRSYVHCKGRARAQDAHFILLIEKINSPTFIHQLAEFMNIEQVSFILIRASADVDLISSVAKVLSDLPNEYITFDRYFCKSVQIERALNLMKEKLISTMMLLNPFHQVDLQKKICVLPCPMPFLLSIATVPNYRVTPSPS